MIDLPCFGKLGPEEKLRCGRYTPEIQTTKVHTETKEYRRPRQYTRSEIEEAIQVEGRPEGGGPGQYRRTEIE